MSPGIPSSLDRQERQFNLIAGTVIIVAAFLAALYLTVFRTTEDTPSDAGTPGGAGSSRLEAYLAEEERASAYAALRDHLDQRKSEPAIVAVFCRDCTHQWRGDVIEFQGDVDFQRPNGALERHNYVAQLRGSEADGWEVLSVEVTPARGFTAN